MSHEYVLKVKTEEYVDENNLRYLIERTLKNMIDDLEVVDCELDNKSEYS